MAEQGSDGATKTQHFIEHAAQIVSAYVSKNSLPMGELPALIASVHAAIGALGNGVASSETKALEPAVPVKKSITRDFLICLDDGKKFRSLRRHLGVLGMTVDEYRAKWNLPKDYPMVAPGYSEKRSALAKANGLGGQRSATKKAKADPVKAELAAEPKRRGRPRKAA